MNANKRRGRPRSVGRRRGSGNFEPIDLGGEYVYRHKPLLIGGKWRVKRTERRSLKESWVTIPEPERASATYERAIVQLQLLAEREAREAHDLSLKSEVARLETGHSGLAPLTLEQGMATWLDYKAKCGADPFSIRCERWAFEKHVLNNLGRALAVHAVTVRDVQRIMIDSPLASMEIRTRLRILGMIAEFFQFMGSIQAARENPGRAWLVPASWRHEKRERFRRSIKVALTIAECRLLMEAAREPSVVTYERVRYGVKQTIERSVKPPACLPIAIALGCLAGLRSSNVRRRQNRVTWGDLKLDPGAERLTVDAKRIKSRATLDVPLNAELGGILREYLRTLGRVPAKTEPVVGTIQSRVWVECVKRAKAKGLNPAFTRFHDLRTTFCSRLCEWTGLGADSVVVKRLRGDALRSVSEDYSSQIVIEKLREAVNSLPRFFDGKPPTAPAPGKVVPKNRISKKA